MRHGLSARKLKQFRLEAKLTQEELAQLADCSDRVVRKLESGEKVGDELRYRIANALAKQIPSISVTDLLGIELAVAKRLWQVYDQHEQLLIDHFDGLSSSVEFIVSGLPEAMSFAGTWHGKDGLARALTLWSQTFRRARSGCQPEFLEAENLIAVRYTDLWQHPTKSEKITPIWVTWYLGFDEDLISKFEFQFNTLAAYMLLVQPDMRPNKDTRTC